jgi:4-hydroxy-tetrahydrodipicolinate synthase
MVQLRSDGPSIPPTALADLHDEVPTVRYFKVETDAPGPYITDLLEATDDEEVHALVGNAGVQMIEALERGAVGVMPGSSLCDVYVRIYEAYRAGNLEEAIGIHADLHELLAHVIGTDIVGYEKEISARRGQVATARCRAPNPPEPDEHHRRLFETYYDRLGQYFRV